MRPGDPAAPGLLPPRALLGPPARRRRWVKLCAQDLDRELRVESAKLLGENTARRGEGDV